MTSFAKLPPVNGMLEGKAAGGDGAFGIAVGGEAGLLMFGMLSQLASASSLLPSTLTGCAKVLTGSSDGALDKGSAEIEALPAFKGPSTGCAAGADAPDV